MNNQYMIDPILIIFTLEWFYTLICVELYKDSL